MQINHLVSKTFISVLSLLIIPATQAEALKQAIPTSTNAKAISPLTLPNLELSSLRQAQRLGPLNPKKEITFTVWLKLRNKPQLEQLIQDLYNPQSPQYQKFLTHEQFNDQYSPSLESRQALQHYFKQRGMKTEQVYSNIRVTGSVQQIEQIFRVQMSHYRYQNKIIYGNNVAPILPASIAPYIAGISGLSDIPYAHPQIRQLKKSRSLTSSWQPEELKMVWDSFLPTATPTTRSLQGFTGQQLRTTYNLANISPIHGTVIDGTGQTIVIIDGCGHASTETITKFANEYNAANNLPLLNANNFAVVKHNGRAYDDVCHHPDGWDGEIMLDVQASHTIAPGANIVLVLTENVENGQVAEALNYITAHNFTIGGFNNAYVVSNSWDNTYENPNEPLDATLAATSAQGLSINFAAGDCGDQTYNSGWTCTKLSSTPSVQYPVSSAYVTAVSGTSLFVDKNWNYAFESGWGTLVNGSFYSGSMGGISQYQNFPAWQTPISNFTAGGYNKGTVGQYNKRALPDIAMLADLYTGLLKYSEG